MIAGDGDYLPLVEETKRTGKIVYLLFFAEFGLNPKLRLASDKFFEVETFFCDAWRKYGSPKI